MKKVRLTICHNPNDPADDLRYASRIRRELWAHTPVEVDPDGSTNATRRDQQGNAYFDFTTDYENELDQFLEGLPHPRRVTKKILEEDAGTECIRCGFVAPPPQPTVCPQCRYREIARCPYCEEEVSRQSYAPIQGDLFQCPLCEHRVRLRFNDLPLEATGGEDQPLILVEKAEAQPQAV